MEKLSLAEVIIKRDDICQHFKEPKEREVCEGLSEQCIVQAIENPSGKATYTLEYEDSGQKIQHVLGQNDYFMRNNPLDCLLRTRSSVKNNSKDLWSISFKKPLLFQLEEERSEEAARVKTNGPSKPNSAKKVDFAAYCEAFAAAHGAGRADVCDLLDPSAEAFSVDSLYREDAGDGIIRVPEYGFVKGRGAQVASRWLMENGAVVRTKGDGEETVGWVDALEAQYFIAGAFGARELMGEYSLDAAVVDGLRELYGMCLKDADGCRNSQQALLVADEWKAVEEEKKARMDNRDRGLKNKQKVERWLGVYDELAKQVKDKRSLEDGVARFKDRMPDKFSTPEERRLAAGLLREMVGVAAKALVNEEKQARLEQEREKCDELIRKGDAFWKKAEALLALSVEQDEYPGVGIEAKDLRKIYQDGVGAKPSWRPSTIEEAQSYSDRAFGVLSKMMRDSSGYKSIEERPGAIGCVHSTWGGSWRNCPKGQQGWFASGVAVSCGDINESWSVQLSSGSECHTPEKNDTFNSSSKIDRW